MTLSSYLSNRHLFIEVREGADAFYLSGFDAKGEPILTGRDDCIRYHDFDEAESDWAKLDDNGYTASIETSAYTPRYSNNDHVNPVFRPILSAIVTPVLEAAE